MTPAEASRAQALIRLAADSVDVGELQRYLRRALDDLAIKNSPAGPLTPGRPAPNHCQVCDDLGTRELHRVDL